MLKNFLLRLRAEGWTQAQIAAKTGLSQTLISKLMRGGNCELESAMSLARAFNTTVEDMVNEPEIVRRSYGNSYSEHLNHSD